MQRPDSSKYKGDGSTSDFITDTDDYIDKIEAELVLIKNEAARYRGVIVGICEQSQRIHDILEIHDHPQIEARPCFEEISILSKKAIDIFHETKRAVAESNEAKK